MSQFEHICVGEADGLVEGSASVINIWCDRSALQENFTVKKRTKTQHI